MIEKIKYTPDAADKLREIKRAISQEYGADNAKKPWQLFGVDTTPQETLDY